MNLTTRAAHLALLFLVFAPALPAQEQADTTEYNLPEIIVTAGRLSVQRSQLTRNIEVITRAEIASSPDYSLQGVLASVPSVDIRRRGPNGVQADISLRGGGFEQTLVMLDGVPINDPQTGHNTLSLPVPMDDVQRIEVLRGPGSRGFGANAFSGAINIITRTMHDANLRFRASGGEHGLFEGMASASLPMGGLQQRITIQRESSDGYRANTDYRTNTASYSLRLPVSSAVFDLKGGYSDREFGANGFYSSRFPNQWEAVKTGFAALGGEIDHGGWHSHIDLAWRNGSDEFLLRRDDPDFYRNVHNTNKHNLRYGAQFDWALGTTALGTEAELQAINSTNLGLHERTIGGIYTEHRVQPFANAVLDFGLYANKFDSFGWDYSPGISAGYAFSDAFRINGSVSRAFRIPTYTELYYEDPANLGNPDLEPERAWTYELGLRSEWHLLRGSVTVFRREADNLIDWVRESEQLPWQVVNATKVNTWGIETSVESATLPDAISPFIFCVRLGYTYLASDFSVPATESKYILDHLRHQFVMNIVQVLPLGLLPSWQVRLLKREDQQDAYVILDLRLTKSVGDVSVFLSATNLTNVSYTEIGTLPMPGRWIQGGVSYNVSFD